MPHSYSDKECFCTLIRHVFSLLDYVLSHSTPFPGQTLSPTCVRFSTEPQVSASSILPSPRHYGASPPLFSSFSPMETLIFPSIPKGGLWNWKFQGASRGPVSITKQSVFLEKWPSSKFSLILWHLAPETPFCLGQSVPNRGLHKLSFLLGTQGMLPNWHSIQSHHPILTFPDYSLYELFPLTILSPPDILCLRGKHTDTVLWKLFMLGISKPPSGSWLEAQWKGCVPV